MSGLQMDKYVPANLAIFTSRDLFQKEKSKLHHLEMKINLGEPQGYAYCGSLGNTSRVFITRLLSCRRNQCICRKIFGDPLDFLQTRAALFMSTLITTNHEPHICIIREVEFGEKGNDAVSNFKCNDYLANAFVDTASEMQHLKSPVHDREKSLEKNVEESCSVNSTLCSGLFQMLKDRNIPFLVLRATSGTGAEVAELVHRVLKDESVISLLAERKKPSQNRPIQETEEHLESTRNRFDLISIGEEKKVVYTQQTSKLSIETEVQSIEVQHTSEAAASGAQSHDGYQATARPLTPETAENQQGNRQSSETETNSNGRSSSPPHPPPNVSQRTQVVKPMLQGQPFNQPIESSPQCCENDELPATCIENGDPGSSSENRQTQSDNPQISEQVPAREISPLNVKGESLPMRPLQRFSQKTSARYDTVGGTGRKIRPKTANLANGSSFWEWEFGKASDGRETNVKKQRETIKKDDFSLPPIRHRPGNMS